MLDIYFILIINRYKANNKSNNFRPIESVPQLLI